MWGKGGGGLLGGSGRGLASAEAEVGRGLGGRVGRGGGTEGRGGGTEGRGGGRGWGWAL